MAKTVRRLQAMGLATRTRFADRTRIVRSRARSINANLKRRNDDKLAEVRRIRSPRANRSGSMVLETGELIFDPPPTGRSSER
ncbi:MAG: hypothetical protein JWR83_437 [Aeromicrobium sp.]|nr:hypothetical protein [Aeromicrobium sp.]